MNSSEISYKAMFQS